MHERAWQGYHPKLKGHERTWSESTATYETLYTYEYQLIYSVVRFDSLCWESMTTEFPAWVNPSYEDTIVQSVRGREGGQQCFNWVVMPHPPLYPTTAATRAISDVCCGPPRPPILTGPCRTSCLHREAFISPPPSPVPPIPPLSLQSFTRSPLHLRKRG